MTHKPTYEALQERIRELEQARSAHEKMITELKRNETRFRKLFEQAPLGYQSLDWEGRFVEVNRTWLEMMGYSRSEVIGRWFGDFLAPGELGPFKERFPRFLSCGEVHTVTQMVRQDGARISVHIDGRIGCDENGHFKQTHCLVHDITDQMAAEKARMESERRQRQIIEYSNAGYFFIDREGCFQKVNPAWLRLHKYETEEEILGKHFSTTQVEEDLESASENVAQLLRGRPILTGEFSRRCRDGSVGHHTFTARPVRDDSGIIGLEGFIIDMTEQKTAEKALRESEERFRVIFETAQDSVFIKDKDRRYTHVNPAMTRLFDLPVEQLVGKTDEDLFGEKASAHIRKTDTRVLDGEIVREEHTKTVGETPTTFHVIKVPVRDTSGKITGLVGIARDITERKENEKALEIAKNQWEATFEAITDWVCLITGDHRILRSNNAVGRLFGLSVEDLHGRRCHELLHGLDLPLQGCPIEKALETGRRETMEFDTADGRCFQVIVDPIEGETGEPLFVHITRDVTEFKVKERERVAARKAEAFSILAGGLAHDYNNLLSVIWGNISLLREDLSDERNREFFEEAERACMQARALTHKFMTLSLGASLSKTPQPVEGILAAVLEKCEEAEKMEVSIEVPEGLPDVIVDGDLLSVALQNIVINAAESMPGGGKLDIRADTAPPDESDRDSAGRLQLLFTDRGKGIAKKDLSKVFDPYFTTKQVGSKKGMGLGLAVSKSILIKHGGGLQIESVPDKGTTVVVTLPAADPAPPAADASFRSADKPTVLVMEDNSALRKMCKAMLERLNCEVISVRDGTEAIEIYSGAVEDGEDFDLVLLDQNIKGGIGGIETLQQLKKLGYQNPAIVATGSPDRPAATDFERFGFDGKLLKPYTKGELEDVIGRYLPL